MSTPLLELPPTPLRCQQRTGVQLAERSDGADGGAALGASELRWLALRSEQHTLLEPSRWPSEPIMHMALDPEHLAAALEQLCPPTAGEELRHELAREIVRAAERFDVDAMLLAALMYQQSGCDPRLGDSWGVGLTRLNPGLLPAQLYEAALRSAAADDDPAHARQLGLARHPPDVLQALLDPSLNLHVAAALLRMYEDRCAQLDAMCGSLPHRHPVSHFIWGDRVRGVAPEDAILTARRRLLAYYRNQPGPLPLVTVGPLTLSSPLDGGPRIVTSGLGEPRDAGRRAHAGVDFLSRVGEPVRAAADGEVLRAGANLRDGSLVDIAPPRAVLVRNETFGARGLFVELSHESGYRSIYAHLASYVVQAGEKVTRGQLIGYVGRTGIRESDPHLHFGLFQNAEVIDPRVALRELLFAPSLEHRKYASPPPAPMRE
ncbi:MAG TPA: M23 family metallopeptidase [Polyangiales bacterium]|nr:M23 family metallopeptidase [Polyangiales bacterium]